LTEQQQQFPRRLRLLAIDDYGRYRVPGYFDGDIGTDRSAQRPATPSCGCRRSSKPWQATKDWCCSPKA
jgi:hypothetical protein